MASIVKRSLADGSTRYQAIIRRGGQSKKKQFRTRAAAGRWARKVEAAIDDGQQIPGLEAERRTVAEVLDRYLEAGAVDHLRTAATRRAQITWWRQRLGRVRLLALDKTTIRRGLRALEVGDGTPTGRPLTPATRRRYLAALRAALGWAVDEGLTAENPGQRAARQGRDVEPPGRVRYLTDEERSTLLDVVDASDTRLAALVRLALLTGMRQGEILGLRWTDLHLDGAPPMASLTRAKGGRGGADTGARSVALSAPAVAILRELHSRRVVGLDRVFAVAPRGRAPFPRSRWEKAVEAAGLEDFHFHDLRHCYASALLSAGGTLPELAAALGHRTLQMVARYSHLEKPHAAALAERVAERMSR